MDIHSVFGILDFRHSFLSSPINIASISELYNEMLEFNPLAFRAAKYPEDLDLLLAEPSKTLVFRKPPRRYSGEVRRFELSSFLSMALFLDRIAGFDRVIEISGSNDRIVQDLLDSGCGLLFDATKALQNELFAEQEHAGESDLYWTDACKTFSSEEFRIPEKIPFHIARSVEYIADLTEDRKQVVFASQLWAAFNLYAGGAVRTVENWLSMDAAFPIHAVFADRISAFLVLVEEGLSSQEAAEVNRVQGLLKDEPNIFALCPDLPISPAVIQEIPDAILEFTNKLVACDAIVRHAVNNAPRSSRKEAAVALKCFGDGYPDASAMKSISEILGIPGMLSALSAGVPINDICA